MIGNLWNISNDFGKILGGDLGGEGGGFWGTLLGRFLGFQCDEWQFAEYGQ